jgi:predicted DNA-binding protein
MEREDIEQAIEDLENFPLTENQQRLVNYLRANIDDIEECMD